MSSPSRRTQHVVEVVRRVKNKTLEAIGAASEGFCAEDRVADFIGAAYSEIAVIHGVTESTVRAACTRDSDIASSRDFCSLAVDAILGGEALSQRLAATSKENESPSDIKAAFVNL